MNLFGQKLFDLDKSKQREQSLQLPLVDMRLVTLFFVAVNVLGAALLVMGTVRMLGWGCFVLLTWQLGLFASAGFIGFLFGIPKVSTGTTAAAIMQAGTVSEASGPETLSRPNRPLLYPSTALQEIVDWLTKIIVGLGLVELKQLPRAVNQLASIMAKSVSVVASSSASGQPDGLAGLGIAVVSLSVGCGFVFGWVITRLYVQGALKRSDGDLAHEDPDALKERLAVSKQMPVQDANIPTNLYSTNDAQWNEDPNKRKFGGSASVGGWLLSASLSPAAGPDKPACFVDLSVSSEQKRVGVSVTFYLHPTYDPPLLTVPTDGNGVAHLKLLAWGAFTVGAEIADGDQKTLLELDLATVRGGTPRFYEE
jgi:hypothetical protein